MRRAHTASQVIEKAQDLYSNSRDLARSGASKANTFMHDRPVLSTALGAGAGFLVGWMFRRST
jgi:ElaB/YqjD/DUF883 family membrane-anchored ribosome-binding protein